MKKDFLNITGVTTLTKAQQKEVSGGIIPDLSKCECTCAGVVTGPIYCSKFISCPQYYWCDDTPTM